MTLSTDFDAIRLAVDLAQLNASDTELDRDRLARTVADQEVTIATHLSTIAAQAQQIADLEAQLAGGGGGDNPPPPEPMLVGTAVTKTTTESWDTATTRFEQMVGKPITIARRFLGGPFTNWASIPQFAVDTGKRSSVVSFKGDPTDVQLVAAIQSIPVDGFTRWLVWNHEPENDGAPMTPAYFRGRQARLLAAWRAAGSPTHVKPMIVLMTWLERDGNASTSSAQWFPDEPAAWTLGLDPYDIPGTMSLEKLTKPTVDLWRAAGGHDWLIAETGTHTTPGATAAAWITTGFDWARSYGAKAVCWFDSGVGANAGPNGWFLANCGQEAVDAFAAQINP